MKRQRYEATIFHPRAQGEKHVCWVKGFKTIDEYKVYRPARVRGVWMVFESRHKTLREAMELAMQRF
jgi:hypothetical protein